MTKRLIIFMILICGVMLINAQESTPEPEQTPEVTAEATESTDDICPMIVNNALDFTQSRCSETDTNEACYGYTFIQANLRSETAQFVQPGDIEEVINIQGLQLSPLDTISGEWGVVVLRVEPNANLLENQPFPEDDVQIVLYGDAQLSDDTQFVEVTATANVNIREFPRTTASIVGSLIANDPVVANGRLEDNSWYRVRIVEEGEVLNAWVSADFLAASFDPETLPVFTVEEAEQIPSDTAATYGPMQAFVFESAEDDAPCVEAPNSGMLIQTPDGVASVNILLDEVVIQLNGTGVISAQADGELTVGVIEGTAQVEAEGGISTAVTGQAIDVPLDSDLTPAGEPEDPRPFDEDEVQSLPLDLLDDEVGQAPVSATDGSGNGGTSSGLSQAGEGFTWRTQYISAPPFICSTGDEVGYNTTGAPLQLTPEVGAIVISGLRYPETSDGVYQLTYADPNTGTLISDTLRIASTDRLSGERVLEFVSPPCTLTIEFVIQLGTQ